MSQEEWQAAIDNAKAVVLGPKKPKPKPPKPLAVAKVIGDLVAEGAELLKKPRPPALPPRPLTPLEKLQRDPNVMRMAEGARLATIAAIPKPTDRMVWVKGTLESILKAHVAGNPKLPPLVVKHIRMALAPLKKVVAPQPPPE